MNTTELDKKDVADCVDCVACPRVTVLYDGCNCLDGLGAAWAAWMKYGAAAEYIPVRDRKVSPVCRGSELVVILDFSYPEEVLMGLVKEGRYVVVLDHHKTAMEKLGEHLVTMDFARDFVVISRENGWKASMLLAVVEMDHSAAVLAWKFFHGDAQVPEVLLYIEDRDLWRWKLPHSRAISEMLFLRLGCFFDGFAWGAAREFNTMDRALLHVTDSAPVVVQGEALLLVKKRMVERICENASELTLGGVSGVQVNSCVLQSEVGEALLDRFRDADFAAVWYEVCTGADWERRYSLRSCEGRADVAEIAEYYGGGGHRYAAGFAVPLFSFSLPK